MQVWNENFGCVGMDVPRLSRSYTAQRADEADDLFLQSVVARQKRVLRDLCAIREAHPDWVDAQVTSALYSMLCWLEDGAQAVHGRVAAAYFLRSGR